MDWESEFILKPVDGRFDLDEIDAIAAGFPTVYKDPDPRGTIHYDPGVRYFVCGDLGHLGYIEWSRAERPDRIMWTAATLDVKEESIFVCQDVDNEILEVVRRILTLVVERTPATIIDNYFTDLTAGGIDGLYGSTAHERASARIEEAARKNETSLNLSHLGLCDGIPEEITALAGLEVLELGHNLLEAIPEAVFTLENLTELKLDHNLLAPAEVAGIGKLRGLRVLDLAANGLEAIPPELGLLTSLEELCLDDNDIEVPEGMPDDMFDDNCAERVLEYLRKTR